MPFAPHTIRADFPLLRSHDERGRLIYFDNAATSLKPDPVIAAVTAYLSEYSANIHRGQHELSERATVAYEAARRRIARFLGATSSEVVFVRGATEGVGLVAAGLDLSPDDNVVATLLEHHSNLLPWRARCAVRPAPVLASGLPDLAAAEALIDDRTRLVTVTLCSNVTGVWVPVADWAKMAQRHGLPLLVDAAQAAAHDRIDVSALDCDFLVLSGHKLCGPPGAGVLYGKHEALSALRPVMIGGGSAASVSADMSYVLRDVPWRLEAGTPDIAAVIGLGAAASYMEDIGLDAIVTHEEALTRALDEVVSSIPGLCAVRPEEGVRRAPICAFTTSAGPSVDWLSRVLSDTYGILTRAGHHCAHPFHESAGLSGGTLRASLAFYNTVEEVARFGDALRSLLR